MSAWRLFVHQFADFVVLLLLLATLVSFVLGDYVEAGAIAAIVLLNAVIGFVQERRADAALEALRTLAAPVASVLRDGSRHTIAARELVPGDVIFLEAGNYAPADAQLIESVNLSANEAALTGESMAVEKRAESVIDPGAPVADRVNMVFGGALIATGRGRAIVTATGAHTELGMIARLMAAIEEDKTPLQRRLNRLGKSLSLAALAVCLLVLLLQLSRATDVGLIGRFGVAHYVQSQAQAIKEGFILAVSLAVAAVPEGLAAIVTINLALGMREMVNHHALVRRLHAVETLGSTTVICSDKTGTMTQNAMMAVRIYAGGRLYRVTGSGYQPDGEFFEQIGGDESRIDPAAETHAPLRLLLSAAALCSDAVIEQMPDGPRLIGDPTEGAIIAAAAKAGLRREALENGQPRIDEIAFDAVRRSMTTLHRDGAARVAYVKGAPEAILPRCGNDTRSLMALTTQMGEQALRVIAVAKKDLRASDTRSLADQTGEGLSFLGLIGMIDPPRPEVADAIELAAMAGVRTIMITGDNPVTARAVAAQVGLHKPAEGQRGDANGTLLGSQINALDDGALRQRLASVSVIARASPEHKLRLVQALRSDGHIVAMTGDGVNDAPALKQADIGVAMGLTGTDVSKESADIVLTDDNFASIVRTLKQGRVIYANIRKFVGYLLGCNAAEVLIILTASALGWPSPLTAIQLLWLNIVTDGAPSLALGLEPAEPDVMQQPPRPPRESILNTRMVTLLGVQAISLAVCVLAVYAVARASALPQSGTLAYFTLALAELPLAYAARSERQSAFKLGLFKNKKMQWAVASSLLLVLATVFIPAANVLFDTMPITAWQVLLICAVAFVPAIAVEAVKHLLRSASATSPARARG